MRWQYQNCHLLHVKFLTAIEFMQHLLTQYYRRYTTTQGLNGINIWPLVWQGWKLISSFIYLCVETDHMYVHKTRVWSAVYMRPIINATMVGAYIGIVHFYWSCSCPANGHRVFRYNSCLHFQSRSDAGDGDPIFS